MDLFKERKMRRAHAGNYYEPLPTHSQYDTGDNLEETNEQMTSDLRNKISALKSLTIDIGAEVRDQNKHLRDLDNEFDRTGGFLGNTMNRVKRLAKSGKNYPICYLLLFSMLVFFILYFYLKFR
nr:PREDICTED: BET1 homolog [Bemisia tabaci]